MSARSGRQTCRTTDEVKSPVEVEFEALEPRLRGTPRLSTVARPNHDLNALYDYANAYGLIRRQEIVDDLPHISELHVIH